MIYCPAYKDILWKQDGQIFSESTVAAKKANHLLPRIDTQMTIDKWARRWTNLNSYKYRELVPAICKKSLRYKLFQLKNTARRGLSKTLQFKSGHCMLISHNIYTMWDMSHKRNTFTLSSRMQ